MKKILSVILTVCMLCGLVPLAVSADDVSYDVTVTGLEYTVTSGQVGEDALTPSSGGYMVYLQSKEGVVFSNDVTVTIGGVKTDAYYAYVWYDSGTNATVMNFELYDVSSIDGDVVITLKEGTALEEAVDLDALSVITEDTVDTVTFPEVAESVYFSRGDSITWVRDPQVYAVTLEEDERVWLRCYSDEDPEGDTYLHVLKKDGSNWVECGYFDTDTVNELQESAVFTADADDTYYIVFTGYDSAVGDYTVEILFENIPEDISTLLNAATAVPEKETITSAKAYVTEGGVYNVYAAYTAPAEGKILLQADGEDVCYVVFTKNVEDGSYESVYGNTVDANAETWIDAADSEYVVVYQEKGATCNVTVKNIQTNETAALDFTADTVPTPGADAKWAWDADSKTLTLKDGFAIEIEEMETEDRAIQLPADSTVIVDGSVYFFTGSGLQASSIEGGMAIVGMGDLTVKGAKEDRSASLYLETGMMAAVGAEKALTVKNCSVNAYGGMLLALESVTVDNISLRSIALCSIAAHSFTNATVQTKIYCKNSDLTVSGLYPFLATDETVLENCVTHATATEMPLVSDGIALIEVKGGSFAMIAMNSPIDLSQILLSEDAECAFLAQRLCLSDKDTVSLPKNIELVDDMGDTIHTGVITEDMLVYDETEEVYYIVVGEGEDAVYASGVVTPYAAKIENTAVTTDAKVYEHDGKIQVTVKADGPAIGVYGNTRLVPVSWKVGELSGTFEDGSNTFEIDASLLAAGEYTLEVTYRLELADVYANYSILPLFYTIWEDISDEDEDIVLTTSTTFTVKAKPTPAPGDNKQDDNKQDNKQDDNKQDNKQDEGNQEVPKPSLDGTKTGDSGAALPWLVLTVVSGLGLIVLQFTKKRKETE